MARVKYSRRMPRKSGGTRAKVKGKGSKQKANSVMKRLNKVRSPDFYGVQKGTFSSGSGKKQKKGVVYRIFRR